jgi:hypothetical protein
VAAIALTPLRPRTATGTSLSFVERDALTQDQSLNRTPLRQTILRPRCPCPNAKLRAATARRSHHATAHTASSAPPRQLPAVARLPRRPDRSLERRRLRHAPRGTPARDRPPPRRPDRMVPHPARPLPPDPRPPPAPLQGPPQARNPHLRRALQSPVGRGGTRFSDSGLRRFTAGSATAAPWAPRVSSATGTPPRPSAASPTASVTSWPT